MVAIHNKKKVDTRAGALAQFANHGSESGESILVEQHAAMAEEGRENEFYQHTARALAEGRLDTGKLSFQGLFYECSGDIRAAMSAIDPNNPRNEGETERLLQEANVNTTLFSNITGQIIYNTLLERYENPAFIGTMLSENVPTKFKQEKIAGITRPGDIGQVVAEGSNYPRLTVSEDFITTPLTTKRGLIIPVTKEAIFFDRTNLVLSRAGEVGHALGLGKEKRILSVVLGVTNNYSRKAAGIKATYATAAQAGGDADIDWINKAVQPLNSYEALDAARILLEAMTDPDTGEPIDQSQMDIIVPNSLKIKSRLYTGGGVVEDGSDPVHVTNMPFPTTTSHSNPWVDSVGGSSGSWWAGDFKGAFKYMENWPITVVQAPAGSTEEFNADIVAQFKASEMGVAASVQPRKVAMFTAS